MSWFSPKRIYLDYAAAAPLLPEAKREMEKYWLKNFYNPNSIYTEGVRVRKEVEEYRARIAKVLGVAKDSIIFTSGGTEANVWALRGVGPGKVIVEEGSHPSVSEAMKGREGGGTVLVSSIIPDNKLGRKIREKRKKNNSDYPLLHVDASQTAAYYNVGLEALAADLVTLDAAKLGGPKGIGALVVRKGNNIAFPPLGTPPVPLIAGFCIALEAAARDREAEYKRLDSLSARLAEAIGTGVPSAEVKRNAPNIVQVSVPGILPELLVLSLDREGVLVSAGPACDSNKPEPTETPVRLSLGRETTEKDVSEAAKIFCETVENLLKYSHAAV
ncbi:aminotransferase class V-fold PLP-dependent enzyme [Candidatus Parcubacteria bacterium]|nr:aminotransferase class V-fold PLP-dependent enzyme [Candidatus Parcubacteria bacterium]